MRALHGDNENILAARSIDGIPIFISEQHPVLLRDRGKFARAYAQKGLRRSGNGFIIQDAEASVLLLRCPQAHFGGMQMLLPALSAEGVPEQRLIFALLQAITP